MRFENLRKALNDERVEKLKRDVEEIEKVVDKSELHKSDFTTARQAKWDELSVEVLKTLRIDMIYKKMSKDAEKMDEKLRAIEEAPDFISCTMSVDWTKSRTWGNCPKCEIVGVAGQRSFHYASGRIGGCGYDKESTAVADALNQFPALMKLLYAAKDENIDKNNHQLFGYGSGYGMLPYFEGGVGVNCFRNIAENIGCAFESVSHGKTFDVYNIIKLDKK